jgi:hypothetical protein
MYVYHISFIHSSIDGQIGRFYHLAILSSAAIAVCFYLAIKCH